MKSKHTCFILSKIPPTCTVDISNVNQKRPKNGKNNELLVVVSNQALKAPSFPQNWADANIIIAMPKINTSYWKLQPKIKCLGY